MIVSLDTDISAVSAKVFFVDEGFFSTVGIKDIRPLPRKFAEMLPSQTFHCILGGVQPIEALSQEQKLGFSKFTTFVYCCS